MSNQNDFPGAPRVKRQRLDVHGILLLDKPVGLTSNRALQEVKHLLLARKAGHTGSLDPLASGLLPLCFGEATKVSRFLLDADKRYRAVFRLGASTSTGDAEGEVLETRPVTVSRREIESAIQHFTGPIEQVPPMYSAIKQGGQPLYKLARAGIVTERAPRPVTIYAFDVLDLADDSLTVDIRCSKGTYVRSLAHDLGELLGCGAHVAELRRTAMGGFSIDETITLEAFAALPGPRERAARLIPADQALRSLPQVVLSSNAAFYFCQGQAVSARPLPVAGAWVRVYQDGGRFLGLGAEEDGQLAPRRLLHATEEPEITQKTVEASPPHG
jgi:tRNA pseudouridine55 synthase